MIEKIEITGFKNFPGDIFFVLDVIPTGFILFGGLNATGKSSVYEIIAFDFGASKGLFFRNKIKDLINSDNKVTHCCVRITLKNIDDDGNRIFPGVESD